MSKTLPALRQTPARRQQMAAEFTTANSWSGGVGSSSCTARDACLREELGRETRKEHQATATLVKEEEAQAPHKGRSSKSAALPAPGKS